MEIYVICALTAIFFLILCSPRRRRYPAVALPRRTTVDGIKELLQPPHATLHELLRARAVPNARLVRAFNIHNAFVSADPTTRVEFSKFAGLLLTDAGRRGWPHWRGVAYKAVDAYLPAKAISFDSFIQAVTMNTVVMGLVGGDIHVANLADIIFVTKGITKLWRLSKTSNPIPRSLLAQINAHLRRWIPDHPNPLDIIIPTWETLWRVVAIALAYVHADDEAQLALHELFSNCTSSQFSNYGTNHLSVEAIIKEVLRLHPPTKHIARAVFRPHYVPSILPDAITRVIVDCMPSTIVTEVADIEAVQQSPIWGYDCNIFDARRHHPSRRQAVQMETLLYFGHGHLKCPASTWAPMAAALVLATIMESVDGVDYEVVRGSEIGGREGWEGWQIRNKEN